MDIHRAILDLEDNGSSQDPVFFEGKEIMAEELQYHINVGLVTPARDIKIGYWGGRDLHLIRRGTLSGMVLDRRRLRARNEKPEPKRNARHILEDMVVAAELEFHPDGTIGCISYPTELRALFLEAHNHLTS